MPERQNYDGARRLTVELRNYTPESPVDEGMLMHRAANAIDHLLADLALLASARTYRCAHDPQGSDAPCAFGCDNAVYPASPEKPRCPSPRTVPHDS